MDSIEKRLTEKEFGLFEEIINSNNSTHNVTKWEQMNALYFQMGKTTLGEAINLESALQDYDEHLNDSYEGDGGNGMREQ